MKISVSNLFTYFSVSGDSKQIKKSGTLTTTRGGGRPLCGGYHPKVPLFLTPPLKDSTKDFTIKSLASTHVRHPWHSNMT